MPESRLESCVLVTGAGKRLGRAIARDLAKAGYKVAVHYNSSSRDAEDVVREIGKSRAVALKANLAVESEVEGLVPRAESALGPVTALVNNASLFEEDSAFSMTKASWEAHMAVNLRAPVLLSQVFAARLPQGAEGAIVNIVDQRVLRLTPKFFSYTVSKAALWAATQTLAQGLAPRIRVNAVGPGPTLKGARQSEADFARQSAATILGRGSPPQDICNAVRYLLSARSVTGQLIAVDGGQHLAWRTADSDLKE